MDQLDEIVCNIPRAVHNGLRFKPERYYLTHEGYPLGTTCWYMKVEIDGYMPIMAAPTPEQVIEKAIDWFKAGGKP